MVRQPGVKQGAAREELEVQYVDMPLWGTLTAPDSSPRAGGARMPKRTAPLQQQSLGGLVCGDGG